LDDLHHTEDIDAICLFLQKARQVRPGFSLTRENSSAVIRICQLVDGNPLGILLAAWLEHFSRPRSLSRLKQFDFFPKLPVMSQGMPTCGQDQTFPDH
jgi:predicted ATPase